ncbi:MAG: hypothetical protein GDA44_09870 [Prochloron sp. SP5CPC1]|nr:hypothetical protein [Candidatus Paraprochloron terpiosi SP5CPC1]
MAIQINKDYYEAYYGMAFAYATLGQCLEAQNALQKALDIKPYHEPSQKKLNKLKCR